MFKPNSYLIFILYMSKYFYILVCTREVEENPFDPTVRALVECTQGFTRLKIEFRAVPRLEALENH